MGGGAGGPVRQYLAASPQLDRVRPRAVGVTAGLAVVLIILLGIVPFPYSFRAPGVVWRRSGSILVNETAGSHRVLARQNREVPSNGASRCSS